MSDSEEENYCFFGKPLAPYDEDSFPKKKPIAIEDQIATDAQGRRRFHGAFTGGFSAGFFNTVGSLEGWTPSDFRSTRQEKAHGKTQKPEDFMDDEDIGEFGIAPQTVRATSDYSTSKKRKKQVFNEGPIPGEPVLHSLLTSGNETIGYLLLKNIGLKNKEDTEKERSEDKVYGCEMPKNYEISRNEEINQYVIPDIYKEFLEKPKSNTFGLGYVGLDKSHINLFKSSNLVIKERNKKKISISGQAFGVGAFEDDDEDIYVKDDMSRYDFELTSEKTPKKNLSNVEQAVFDDFILAKNILAPKEVFAPPTIPHSFTGKHKVKRSRFEPLPSEVEPVPERRDMNPEIRAKCLGEEPTLNPPKENIKTEPPPEKLEENLQSKETKNILFDRFVSASQPEDPSNILEVVQPSETTHGTQEMRDAARMKMFGPLTRIISDWHPCSLLCKRFNVPEPHFDELNSGKNRKRTKNLIFEYEKFSEISTDFKPGLSSKDESSSVIIEDNNQTNSNIEEPSTSKEIVKIEEETPKDITEKIDVNKNIDLFKAVFLSSSESEDEQDEEDATDKSIEMKTSILSDSLLPKIKPIKEGILSGVDFSIFQNTNSEEKVQKQTDNNVEETKLNQQNIEASYGPSLPEKLSKNMQYTSNVPMVQNDDNDEWVEKKDKKNKNSHKKKHKNKKSSHKKKHKHSRD